MNKREFLSNGARLAVVGGATSIGLSVTSVGFALEVSPALETQNKDTVEVLEFFWFGCPHCFAFEPAINSWVENKPDHVSFVRSAPPLNRSWVGHSMAYYAAKELGVVEEFFEPFFNAIHIDKRKLSKVHTISEFAGELGLDKDRFAKTMQSNSVEKEIKKSIEHAIGSKITGVPSLLVNGRYVTGPSMAGSYEETFKLVDKFVEEEHQKMKG